MPRTLQQVEFTLLAATLVLVSFAWLPWTEHPTLVKTSALVTGVLLLLLLRTAQAVTGGTGAVRAAFSELLPRGAGHWAVLGWLGLNWLSLLWSRFPKATLDRLAGLTLLVLWAWLVAAGVRSREAWNRLLRVYLICGVAAATVALLTHLLGVTPLAAVWPFGNPNFLAGYLLIPLGLAWGVVLQQGGGSKRRSAAAAVLLLLLAALWFTRSLSGLIAGVAVVALAAVARLRPAGRYRVVEVALGVCLLVGGVAARVAYSLGAEGLRVLGPGWTVRGFLWKWSLLLWRLRPLLGWGAGAVFPTIMPVSNLDRYRYPDLFSPLTLHSHNEFLEVMVELGLVGLAAFLVMVYLAARPLGRAWMRWERARLPGPAVGLFAGFLGLNLQACFSVAPRFTETACFYWLAVGLLIAWPRVAAGEAAEPGAAPLRSPGRRALVLLVLAAVAAGWLWHREAWLPLRAARDFEAGLRAQKEGDLSSARRYYRQALAGRPSYPDRVRLLKRLGDLAFRERRFDEAVARYREARRLAPGVAPVTVALADALVLGGQTEESLALYRETAVLAPGYPDLGKRTAAALSMLARGERASGRLGRAIDLLKEAAAQRPDHPDYHLELARWLLEAGRDDEAEEILKRTAERFAEDPAVREEVRRLRLRLRSPGPERPRSPDGD